MTDLNRITEECLDKINKARDTSVLYEVRVAYLGKNGELTALLKGLKSLPDEQRPTAGKMVNEARERLENAFRAKEQQLSAAELTKKLKEENIDITLRTSNADKSNKHTIGGIHPLSAVLKRAVDFFVALGFTVEESREIETPRYNFDALNTPKDHPARDAQDTFFISPEILLRSQTSTGQIRTMEKTTPPIKMISPGRVYRADEVDATHTPCFHQLEGLVVAKGMTMCHLKGILSAFAKHMFDERTKIRFRPSFFPFTEPSVEVDALCSGCGGAGCRICKGQGWIELLGAGMVNRRVLAGVGIDPDIFTGFAFGMGLDRMTAIIHGIPDARIPFEGDIRFLKQFMNA